MAHLDFPWEFKFASDEANQGAIEGYASVFGLLDRGGDIVQPGAFKATLADWRKRKGEFVPMLWQHDTGNPIGIWTDLAEDERGLKVAGELILDVPQAKVARSLMLKGALKGLSIGFRTRDSDTDRTTGARLLKKVDLYEISPVTFAMQPEAQVTAVKGETILSDAGAMEQAYRDGGLSNREAKIAVAVTKTMVLRDGARNEPGQRDVGADVLMAIRRATESLCS